MVGSPEVEQITPSRQNEEAFKELESFFSCYPGPSRRLRESELELYSEYYSFIDGWEISPPLVYNNTELKFHFLVEANFPHSKPKIAIRGPQLYLEWPHIENETGLLCLWTEETPHSIHNIRALSIAAIKKAYDYSKKNIQEIKDSDFQRELPLYWARESKGYVKKTAVLLSTDTTSRGVKVFELGGTYFFSENKEDFVEWYTRKNKGSKPRILNEFNSCVFHLNVDLAPSQYPSTIKELFSLLDKEELTHRITLIKKFREFAKDFNPENCHGLPVLLAFKIESNLVYVGCLLKVLEEAWDGFRNLKNVKEKLSLSDQKCFARFLPQRADYNWLQGRGVNPDFRSLQNKSVLILGCGSAGSGVARLLVQSGLKKITFVDHEELEWANIARHELGSNSVGANKAKELKLQLESNYPYLEANSFDEKWENLGNKISILKEHDLIISCIEIWNSELELSQLILKENIATPIIYSWLEAFSTAGHAVVINTSDEEGCFACGFNDLGHFKYKITDYPKEKELFYEPGCSGAFQPYGAIQLNPVHSLAAELALEVLDGSINDPTHRIWLGQEKHITRYGGNLTDFAKQEIVISGNGSVKACVVERKWEKSTECKICNI